MGPKVMKKVKETLPKGQVNKSSSSKGPLPKGKTTKTPLPKGKAQKGKTFKKFQTLRAHNLKKLGAMKLSDRIQQIGNQSETAQEAAVALKETLTKGEASRAWSAHQTHLKKNEEAAAAFTELTKKEKGLAVALFLVKDNIPKFMHITDSHQQSQSLDKREKFESETSILQRFSKEELDLHLASGRVSWRYDLWGSGVVEYCDHGNLERVTRAKRTKEYVQGQEYEACQDSQQEWEQLAGWSLEQHLQEAEGFKGAGKGKGKAIGKGKTLTKGKGQLALEDKKEQKTPEQEWHDCLNKVKKARDGLTSIMSDFEAARQKCDLAKRLTKTVKREGENLMALTTKTIRELKGVLMHKQKAMSLTKAKTLVQDAAQMLKDLKDEVKEMNHMASKVGSKASKK